MIQGKNLQSLDVLKPDYQGDLDSEQAVHRLHKTVKGLVRSPTALEVRNASQIGAQVSLVAYVGAREDVGPNDRVRVRDGRHAGEYAVIGEPLQPGGERGHLRLDLTRVTTR